MIDNSYIQKYLEGTLDSEGFRVLHSWLEESGENKAYLFSMKEAYLGLNAEMDKEEADTDREWKRFLNRSGQVSDRKKWRKAVNALCTAAAAAAIFIIGHVTGQKAEETVPFDGEITIQTEIGQQSRMTLPDGTSVLLNDCSKLTYNPTMWTSERKVALEGQASFDVMHMENFPFKVKALHYDINVLGTSFDISCYKEDNENIVSLKQGKVEIEFASSSSPAYLKPGETLTYDTSTGKYRIDRLPEKLTYAWEDKAIVFNDNTLADKAGELYRHYGYKFNISEECAGLTYNGVFKGDNIHEFISVIDKITPQLHYSLDIDSKTISIWK